MTDTETDDLQIDDIAADIRNAAAELSSKALGEKLSSSDAALPPADGEAPEVAQQSQGERARDASGKFVKVEQQADASAPAIQNTDVGQKTEQPAQTSTSATPPSFLSAEAKALWAQTPSAIQAALIKRDADANEGGRQWSEQRKAVEQALSPLHELSQQNGIPWQDGLNRLLNVERSLQNPATAPQMLAQLAKAYNVDLAALVNGNPQPQSRVQPQFDPNIILQQVNRQVAQQLQEHEQDQALNAEVRRFMSERGPDGQLAHPHFEAVKSLMGQLMTSRQADSLQDAYDKATWAMPDIRSQLIALQAAPKVNAQKQQVDRARKAAVSVSGAPDGRMAKPNGFDKSQSLDDDIREAIAMHRH